MQYHALFSFVHEISLYDEYGLDDFRPPYAIGCSKRVHGSANPALSPAHFSAILASISSAHSLLNIFIAMAADTLRCCPVSVFSRTAYAIFLLVKISVSTIQDNGALSGLVQPEATNIKWYIHQVLKKLEEVSTLHCRVAAKWLLIIQKIQEWFSEFIIVQSGEGSPSTELELIEPLRHFSIRAENRPLDTDESPTIVRKDYQGNQGEQASRQEAAVVGVSSAPGEPFSELEFPMSPYGLNALAATPSKDADSWMFAPAGGEEGADVFQPANWAGL